MNVVLDLDLKTSARVVFDEGVRMSHAEFEAFCAANRDVRAELTANGELVLMAPANLFTSISNNRLGSQLCAWTDRDGRGYSVDSNTVFWLPNGAGRGPDAAWVAREKVDRLDPESASFARVVPDFIVELMSPSDRLKAAKAKMGEWMENGVQLGWLIDRKNKRVFVYRPGQQLEELTGIDSLAAEAPVDGFVLDLAPIWKL